ncbi:MAG: hypothetical protein AB1486_26585 [Planctomycetota bacterium]
MPIHPRVLHALTAFLAGLTGSMAIVQAARTFQVVVSPEAGSFVGCGVFLWAGVGWLIANRRAGAAKHAQGREGDTPGRHPLRSVRAAAPPLALLVWVTVDPGFLARAADWGTVSWGSVFAAPQLYALPFCLAGMMLAAVRQAAIRAGSVSQTACADLLVGVSLGAGLGATLAPLQVLPSSLATGGTGGARFMSAAALLLVAVVRVVEENRLTHERKESAPSRGGSRVTVWLVAGAALVAGMTLAVVTPILTRPLQGSFLARPLLVLPVVLGTLLGSSVAAVLAGLKRRPAAGPLPLAALALGASFSFLSAGLSVTPPAFDNLLARLERFGWGATDTTFILAALLPAVSTLLLGLSIGFLLPSLAGRAGASLPGIAAVVGSLAWLAVTLALALGLATGRQVILVATVLAGTGALAGTLSPRSAAGLLARFAAAVLLLSAAGAAVVWMTESPARPVEARPGRQARLLGPLETTRDAYGRVRLVIDGCVVPAGPGAEGRAVIASLVQSLHAPPAERALVIEPGVSPVAKTLKRMGAQSIAVIDLVNLDGSPARGVRPELARLAPRSFDLIVQEPVDPRRPESASVLTTEHFERLRRLLREDGALVVWLPLDRMRWESFGIVARSFRSALGSFSLWLAAVVDEEIVVGLVGRDLTEPVEWSHVLEILEKLPDLELASEHGVADPVALLARYVGDDYFVGDRFVGRAENSDERPVLERAELGRFELDADLGFNNVPLLLEAKESFVGRVLFGDLPGREAREIERRLRTASGVLKDVALAANLFQRADRLREIPSATGEKPEAVEDQAIARLWPALKNVPGDVDAHGVLLDFIGRLTMRGQLLSASQLAAKVLDDIAPADPRYINCLGVALLARGKDDEVAAETLRRAVDRDPDNPVYRANLGVALAFIGRAEEGLGELRRARSGRGSLWPLSEGIWLFLEGDLEGAQRWLEPLSKGPPWGDRLRPFLSARP